MGRKETRSNRYQAQIDALDKINQALTGMEYHLAIMTLTYAIAEVLKQIADAADDVDAYYLMMLRSLSDVCNRVIAEHHGLGS